MRSARASLSLQVVKPVPADPGTQVGACIVDSDNRIVGIGYNGFPRGCDDDVLPWARTADSELDTKYPASDGCSCHPNTLTVTPCACTFLCAVCLPRGNECHLE